jgi:putative transposase
MPSGLKRFQKAESLHFITFSCFRRLPLLETPGARETVEAVLEQTRARHHARVYAYVLMPEHVHLLVNEPPQIVLAQFLKAVKQMTSRKLRGPREKFWQDRYYDSNVHGEQARCEVIRYIHRNPVKRGLVAKPEEWPWSSFRHYATGVEGAVEIESQWTAFLRDNQLPAGVRIKEGERSCFPTQAAKGAAWMGH